MVVLRRIFTLLLLGAGLSTAADEGKPNIVLIYADDMGYGEIQRFYPEMSKVPTPHLNELCDEGMMFTDAHTSASVCTPSRYSLLTGRYNWRSTHQSGVLTGGKPCLIAPDRMTLASLFRKNGYATSMFGKWHLDFQYSIPEGEKAPKSVRDSWNYGSPIGTKVVDGPVTRGFDYFLGFHHSRTMSSLIENDQVVEYVKCLDTMDRLTGAVVDYIEEHATQKKEEPFFLYYPLNSPHAPVVPKSEWKGRGGIDDAYTEFVAQTDDTVGQVLEAIEKNGLKDNTVVLFATDNGCHQSPEKFLPHGHSVSGPFRDKKGSIYEGGHRIPFVVRWPGTVEAGSKSDQLVCMTDVFATFADYFDLKYNDATAEDSMSFLPVLQGQETKGMRSSVVHHDAGGRFAIREGDWKLVLMKDGKVQNAEDMEAKVQLYHLSEDITESKNLANEHPEKVESMIALIEKQVEMGRTTPGERQANDTNVVLWKKVSKNKKTKK